MSRTIIFTIPLPIMRTTSSTYWSMGRPGKHSQKTAKLFRWNVNAVEFIPVTQQVAKEEAARALNPLAKEFIPEAPPTAFIQKKARSFRWNVNAVEFRPAAHRVAKEETAPAAEPPPQPFGNRVHPRNPTDLDRWRSTLKLARAVTDTFRDTRQNCLLSKPAHYPKFIRQKPALPSPEKLTLATTKISPRHELLTHIMPTSARSSTAWPSSPTGPFPVPHWQVWGPISLPVLVNGEGPKSRGIRQLAAMDRQANVGESSGITQSTKLTKDTGGKPRLQVSNYFQDCGGDITGPSPDQRSEPFLCPNGNHARNHHNILDHGKGDHQTPKKAFVLAAQKEPAAAEPHLNPLADEFLALPLRILNSFKYNHGSLNISFLFASGNHAGKRQEILLNGEALKKAFKFYWNVNAEEFIPAAQKEPAIAAAAESHLNPLAAEFVPAALGQSSFLNTPSHSTIHDHRAVHDSTMPSATIIFSLSLPIMRATNNVYWNMGRVRIKHQKKARQCHWNVHAEEFVQPFDGVYMPQHLHPLLKRSRQLQNLTSTPWRRNLCQSQNDIILPMPAEPADSWLYP
ncbi:hypothetical protein DFS34DRAFT_673422 [Phlyctochytrium arcticum]|nr:hypothetical protein DFS34DRAFT_673422 [Phlyctochytrium arcticum]